MYDLIVIGGGPAGMTAALYALRNGKSVLVLEKHGFGGQITYSPKVENYPAKIFLCHLVFPDFLNFCVSDRSVTFPDPYLGEVPL